MFALIITIVSIALVAILALATLYYGGSAFGKGAARAEASKIVLQGQQLLGAADLYYTENRKWPTSINELTTDKYLKQIPNAGVSGLADAVAAGTTWTMPIAETPMFVMAAMSSSEVCAEVNLSASLRKKAILQHAYMGLVAQCYGATEPTLKTVFKKAPDTPLTGPGGTGLGPDEVIDGDPPTDPTDPDWFVQPDAGAGPGGGGGGGGPVVQLPGSQTCDAATGTVFGVPNVIKLNPRPGYQYAEFEFVNNTGSDIQIYNLFDYEDGYSLGWVDGLVPGDPYSSRWAIWGGDGPDCLTANGGRCWFEADLNPTVMGGYRFDFVLETSAGNFPMTVCGTNTDAAADVTDRNWNLFVDVPSLTQIYVDVLGKDMQFASMSVVSPFGVSIRQLNDGDEYWDNGVVRTWSAPPWQCSSSTPTQAGNNCVLYFETIALNEVLYETPYTVTMQATDGVLYSAEARLRISASPTPDGSPTARPETLNIDLAQSYCYNEQWSINKPDYAPHSYAMMHLAAEGGTWLEDMRSARAGWAVDRLSGPIFGPFAFLENRAWHPAYYDFQNEIWYQNAVDGAQSMTLRSSGSAGIEFESYRDSINPLGGYIASSASDAMRFTFVDPQGRHPNTTVVAYCDFSPGAITSTSQDGPFYKVYGTARVTSIVGGNIYSSGSGPQPQPPAAPAPVDYIQQAGNNLFEVPVNTPWSGSCTSSDAGQHNICAAEATRVGGGYTTCQRYSIEPSPTGGVGTYQSRIRCTR